MELSGDKQELLTRLAICVVIALILTMAQNQSVRRLSSHSGNNTIPGWRKTASRLLPLRLPFFLASPWLFFL